MAEEEPQQKSTGTVKWFNSTKGFGFITPEGGGEDLFVHQTSIDAEGFRSLREGEAVEFYVEAGEDGRTKAVNVTGPGGAVPQGAPRRPYYGGQGGGRGVYPQGPAAGYGGRGRGRVTRPPYGGRAGARVADRRPPPGTPGVSSGLQVVVHNLPWSCTWQTLKDAFAGTGNIERADVIQDNSGRSRGFGTVRYATKEEALASAEKMNNTDIGGRTVTVRIDRFA